MFLVVEHRDEAALRAVDALDGADRAVEQAAVVVVAAVDNGFSGREQITQRSAQFLKFVLLDVVVVKTPVEADDTAGPSLTGVTTMTSGPPPRSARAVTTFSPIVSRPTASSSLTPCRSPP
jgi:hypothetical protein